MTLDIKDFYYGTSMARYESMKIAMSCIPDEIIDQYSLTTIISNVWVYLEIRKGMPGLKQAGLISNDRLKAHLIHFSFALVPRTPALWKHATKPINCSLVIDGFGVKYIGKDNSDHLIQALKNSTPSPSTGPVLYSAKSPSTGTMPHTPATSPCQNIYKQP